MKILAGLSLMIFTIFMGFIPAAQTRNSDAKVPETATPPRDDVYYAFRGLDMTFRTETKPDFFEGAIGVGTKTIYDKVGYITVVYCGYSDEEKKKNQNFGNITYVLFSKDRPKITMNQDSTKPSFTFVIDKNDYESTELFTFETVWVGGSTDSLASVQTAVSGIYNRQSSYPLKWAKTWTGEELKRWFNK